MTTTPTVGRAHTGPTDHRHIPFILDTITGISARETVEVFLALASLVLSVVARRVQESWVPA